MRGKFSFQSVDFSFDVTKCKFILENSILKMLGMYSPIFVADTKLIFGYNFVALLKINYLNLLANPKICGRL